MPTVRLLPKGIEIRVPKGARLIDVVCGKCGVRILSGRVSREAPVERRAKERNRVAPELRLACALRVNHDLSVSADYW